MPAGLLEGFRIVEVADEKGHFCGRMAAAMGADVIKVEPLDGEPTRRFDPRALQGEADLASLFFRYHNTGKRSVALDLDRDDGRRIFRRIAASADGILESRPPGWMEARGLGPDALREARDELVYVSITPFGRTGPYRDYATSDLVSWALGGPLIACGYDDRPGSPPIRCEGHQPYSLASLFAFSAMMLGLVGNPPGGDFDVSIHEACAATVETGFPYWVYRKERIHRQTGRQATVLPIPSWQYRCRDGRHVSLMGILPRDQRSWDGLRVWMAEHGMVEDLEQPEYRDIFALRPPTNRDPAPPAGQRAMAAIGRFVSSLDSSEVYARGQALGLPWGVVLTPYDAAHDEQPVSRGFLHDVTEQDGSVTAYPGLPWVLSDGSCAMAPAPALGQHTREVLRELAGLDESEILQLVAQGTVALSHAASAVVS